MRPRARRVSTLVLSLLTVAVCAQAEVMLQWFETEWDEIYRRMPEVAQFGYDYIWTPPPTKAPTGLGTKWGNVGYNLYDRFDLGDVPQRGSWATRYGTRGSLRNMVDSAHQCDVKIIPDIIMNHNGNGPDFRSYPGMKPEDFHVQWEQGHANTLNYKRGPRMDQWYHGEGYGATMWQELVNLIDLRTEPDNRFTGGNNTPGWSFVSGTSYLRHVGQYERYPYYSVDPNTYSNETAQGMLDRWITWLGNAMDYDGLRLDAGKHVPWEFFGQKGAGFLHEAQYNYNQRRGYSDSSNDEADQLFQNYVRRDDALIFAEILSYQSELAYWFGGQLTSPANCTRNPMRFLDYPLKQKLYTAFSSGDLASLTAGGGGITPELGIMYAWGHDEAGPNKVNLAYAYILTHVGFPMVYFTGNNITWADNGTKTWMRPGYDSQALGDNGNDLRNLVWIHQQFARGREYDRWSEGDFFAYERYDDDGDSTPETGEGVLLVCLNDSGSDLTKNGITVSFPVGTVLHDYTGHNLNDATVYDSGGPKVNITVPGNYGQGWVCYAPRNAEGVAGESAQVKDNGSAAGTIPWVVPGGIHAAAKTQQITRVTSTNLSLDVYFNPTGGTVSSVMLKWGQGKCRLSATNEFDTGNGIVSGGYEKLWQRNSTNWYLDIQVGATNIPEGLNVVKARVFNQRAGGLPPLYNTFTKLIYVDTRGPQLNIAHPTNNQTLYGDAVMLVSNADFTAYGMTVSVDGGGAQSAHEIMKGLWKYGLIGLSQGIHTVTVAATEADWAATRQVINTSIYTRVFSVVTNQNAVSLNHADGSTQYLPFFQTVVTAPGSPTSVRLYWDGYELLINNGNYTNVFHGEVLFRDSTSIVTDRLWGAFVNGQHFFEAVRVDAGVTSRCVRRVLFNLYATNAIDSDGDSIPDNIEMPFIDTDGAPGADAPWPGDSNKDFVQNYGETWTKLNPYNHSTYYSSQWDDRNDFDGDGFSNGEEVIAGYNEGNIYKYSIYSASSKPSGSPTSRVSTAYWTPEYAVRNQGLAITYSPNDGLLKGFNPVVLHIGHSKKTAGSWQGVQDFTMSASGTNWTYTYTVPTNATSVDFCFRSADTNTWDNHNGSDWQANVEGATNRGFVMDGYLDSDNYVVFPDNMRIAAAVNGENLYVATWSTEGNDVFVYVTDELGDAADPAPGWSKAGKVFVNTAAKPYMTAEADNKWCAWNHITGAITNGDRNPSAENALEGEINLVTAFGHVPEAVYIASVAYGTADGGGINSQGPYLWNSGNDLEIMEFLRVPIASIRDEDMDGVFDVGKPQMWTVVNGNTNDANYGLRRLFLNELAGDSQDITVILQPNTGTNVVSDVELFSNLNRRDFAVMEEDPSTVSVNSKTTYYRAYPMTDLGGGRYGCTIPVTKCGAYRINARYKVNGGSYVYYSDGGLRRDCAVAVSPKKALQMSMYELNPLFAEATNDNFYGRSTFEDMYIANTDRYDAIDTNHFAGIGANMVWLQPIHPIGSDGRQTDPATGQPYDPGSPYAVRNYWKVNAVLGDPYEGDGSRAMQEFTNFVQALDGVGVGVMLDGTFNHSAWDCEIGDYAVEMGLTYLNSTGTVVAVQASDLIRAVRPQWYSKKNDYGSHATYYQSGGNNDIAVAPDRVDFGKWSDAADFFFGKYDCLVQKPPTDTNWAWSSSWYSRYLFEEDRFEGHDPYTRELWEYFAHYPVYWLEKTGHPAGTPKSESYRGIDGLRCDFAQGLPSAFWEYCINKTRSVKWDFIFMAESLDGYWEPGVNGSKRHGVGFRSSRHFDVLNENMIFYWRNNFFSYPYEGPTGPNNPSTPDPTTGPTAAAFDNRRQAFDNVPVLLDLSCHDEVYPSDDSYRLIYAHSICAAMDGVPMLFYGQEAGAQNDNNIQAGVTTYDHNFNRYEVNFNKSIPNFKRYNCMSNIWAHRDSNVQNIYGRINKARLDSPALMSQQNYFLNRTDTGNKDADICGIARFEIPGVSAASQDVVFVFVNNNYWASTNRGATYFLNTNYSNGKNWFGIEASHSYNIVDLMSSTPTNYIWDTNKTGSALLSDGIGVWLHENTYDGKQAQYLRLIDRTAGITPTNRLSYYAWDRDHDGLPDAWESANGLDPNSASGNEGAGGDKDGDGLSNMEEFLASTRPNDTNDLLEVNIVASGGGATVSWPGKTNTNYRVERTDNLLPSAWQSLYFGTALSATESVTDASTTGVTSRFYRVMVKP